jgi:hypothetical protein
MRYKNYLFLLIFTCWVNLLFAQEVYSGEYTLKNGYSGHSTHEYKFVQQKKVLHGPFTFQSDSSYSFEDEDILQSRIFKGNYRDGIPNGLWQILESELQKSGDAIYDGENIVYQVRGNQKKWSIPYQNGETSGRIDYHHLTIENGQVKDTLFSASASVSENQMFGEITSYDKRNHLTFYSNEQGFFDQTYTFTSNSKFKDTRLFDNGFIRQHQIAIKGQEIQLQYIDFLHQNEDLATVQFTCQDELYKTLSYFARKELYNIHNKAYEKDWLMEEKSFLDQSLSRLIQVNDEGIWNYLDGAQTVSSPVMQLKRVELDSQQKASLDSIQYTILALQKGLDYYLKDAQVEFNRYMSDSAAYHYAAFEEIQRFLSTSMELHRFINSERLSFIDFRHAIHLLFKPYTFQSTILYDYNDKEHKKTIATPEKFDYTDFNLRRYNTYLSEVYALFETLDKSIRKAVEQNIQNLSIAEKEQKLIRYKDTIVDLFRPENTKMNEFHRKYGERISAFISTDIKRYAALPVSERILEIDNRLTCYENHLLAYNELEKLETRVIQLKELYTRTIWNAFTFTEMDEIVKERVYNAYRNILLDFVLENMFSAPSCGNLEGKLDNFARIYRRMLVLRDQDTKEIERKLKRINNPAMILEILEIELKL